MLRRSFALALLSVALLGAPAFGAGLVGQQAPEVKPNRWLNHRGPVVWKDLLGRVLLVEKWATWCGPCKAQVPHLNSLHSKYEAKGLTIIGVSDEPPAKIEPYLKANKVQYLIASGGGQGYQTRGIPHAWLVAPDGKVVWEGHPGNLQESQIEEHLKSVRLGPAFGDLPEKAHRARKLLEAGKLAMGVKEFEKLKDDPEAGAAAKAAIEKVTALGQARLQRVEELAAAGSYGQALELLDEIEKRFKGLPTGDQAKEKKKAWKKDKQIKAELEGAKILDKAEALIKANRQRDAARLLTAMTKRKKFEGTHCCDKAKELLKGLEAYH